MTIVYFILILGITIFVHELGHFIFAKKAGIHVYEFALGMGPQLFKFNRKNDETTYSLRLFPIGGYVQMAGEAVNEDDEIPEHKRLYKKSWGQRFSTIIAGILFNFIFAILIFFIIGVVNGSSSIKPKIAFVEENSPAFIAGIKKGDEIIKMNNTNILTIDHFMLELTVAKEDTFKLTLRNNNINRVVDVTIKDGALGIGLDLTAKTGFFNAIGYSLSKTFSILHQMSLVIGYLIIGKLKLSALAGPVGIYTIVGDAAAYGFLNLMYLTALISLNVGFMNLMPIPAFDGGRLLFLLIEKIKGKPVDTKIENTIHAVGFVLLMILMVIVTFNDILKIFN